MRSSALKMWRNCSEDRIWIPIGSKFCIASFPQLLVLVFGEKPNVLIRSPCFCLNILSIGWLRSKLIFISSAKHKLYFSDIVDRDIGENGVGIQILYSERGTRFQNSYFFFLQWVHPHVWKVLNSWVIKASQSISIVNRVAMIPGARMTGEQGPFANSKRADFLDLDLTLIEFVQ